MNNNWKFFIHKYRNAIAISITVFVCVIMLVGMFLFSADDDTPIISFVPTTDYAEYYVAAKNNTLALYDLSGTKLSEISYKELILPKELQEEIIIYSNDNFHKIVVEQTVSGDEHKYKLTDKKIDSYTHSIADFSYDDNYIVVKRNDGSFEILERQSDTVLILKPAKTAETFLLKDGYLIYSSENTLNSIEIKTQKEQSIDLGSTTFGLSANVTSVFAFNNFGNGKGTTSIFVLNPSDLYIQNAISQKSLNVYPLLNGIFLQKESALQVFNYRDDKYSSKTLSIKDGENPFGMKNTIIIGDYLYTNKDGSIIIISMKSKLIERTLEIESDYFWPTYVSKK